MQDPQNGATGAVEAAPLHILDAPACHLGEGPTYDPASDKAWWFDIVGRRLFEKSSASPEVRVHELPLMASQLCTVDDRTQVIATENGLHVRDIATGRLTHHTALEAHETDTRSNDGRVHPSGALWIGTMGRKAEAGRGSIYWFRGGELRRLYAEITIPNAICFSPDGTVGYFADTARGDIHRVALDPETGLPTGEPSVFVPAGAFAGGPDGAVTDAEGNVWNARWGAGRLEVFTPDGKHLRSLSLPARQPSCPAFTGRHLDQLLVTTAYEGMDEEERAGDPNAGRTFIVQAGVRGVAEPRLRLTP
ncbi:SMP-30/gluconolactonase/LRE family protein [uncultured Aureimonas sp.]|uniref:SMP-30/gluconolactonase/LRE family protein n=1 Tax=uncultured Aureimonas sp. TaxID=1604662 RepID=UPI0025CC8186|nr:SMP-30/gluconolactonase/LRE family protein [uncultured Aureimonas sp.]